MRTAASSDVLRGAIGRARRTDPPSGGLFHVWARISAGSNAAPYNLHGPVRIPDEFPTVRALGRAAAAVLLLRAVLRRGGAGQGRRADTTREFESVSRVADVLSRTGDVEGAARALLDELAELFDLGFAALTFVSDARRASGLLERGPRGDADARRRGGRGARASAGRGRAGGGPEAERGAARAADRPASGSARAQQRARPAGRPPAAGRPARAAPRRRRGRLLPRRQRTRPFPLRRRARLRQFAALLRVPDGARPGRRRHPRGAAVDRER